MAAGAGAATAGVAEDSTGTHSRASPKEGCSPPKILGMDLSLLSGAVCRKPTNDHQQPQEYSCQYVPVPEQQLPQIPSTQASFPKQEPPSPAETERTQLSFSSWVNNGTSNNLTHISSTDLHGALSFEVEMPARQCQDVHRVSSTGSNWRPMDIINLSSSSFSSAGKSVLKSIRKNISIVASKSFDSGMLKKKKRKKKSKVPREVIVKVVEGEGVEVSANPSICESESNTSSNSSQMFIAKGGGVEVLTKLGDTVYDTHSSFNADCKSTKLLRDASTFESTFATTSLTSGEESDNAEGYKDDADIRRLYHLMDKIRKGSNEDQLEIEETNRAIDIHRAKLVSTPVESVEAHDHHCREKVPRVMEVIVEPGNVSPLPEPSIEPEINTDDIFDLMIFVNNEHKVLEYAPEEFETLDRH